MIIQFVMSCSTGAVTGTYINGLAMQLRTALEQIDSLSYA